MNKTTGLIIGSRKAGTTWLYENMLSEPSFDLPRDVKETRFFLRQITETSYNSLFDCSGGTRIEVDTALAYEDLAVEQIKSYNPEMRILLILRDPTTFAVSRFIHATRKGETTAKSVTEAIEIDQQIRQELDYAAILNRYEPFEHFKALRFERIQDDPAVFYETACSHLAPGVTQQQGRSLLPPVNKARDSRWPIASAALSRAATKARGIGLNRLVNSAKSIGLHSAIEQTTEIANLDQMANEARTAVEQHYPESIRIHEAMA